MAFKRSDLKDLVVERPIEPVPGHGFTITIKVVEEEEQRSIAAKNTDFAVCESLIVGVSGYLNEQDNEMPLDSFLIDLKPQRALVVLCAQECWLAQQDALLKN